MNLQTGSSDDAYLEKEPKREFDQAIIERLLELGLDRDPFSDKGIDGLFYPGEQRQEYLELLPHLSHYSHYFVVLIGTKGCGKTILKERFLQQFDPSLTKMVLIDGLNVAVSRSAEELLASMVDGFRIPEKGSGVSSKSKVEGFIQVNGENGIDCIFVADNAELLSEDSFVVLFDLLAGDQCKNFHVILFASPDINDVFKSPLIRKSYEEWGHLLVLDPFSESETREYVDYRLITAGLTDIRFDNSHMELIYQQSKGIPDLINRHARQVLLQVLTEGAAKKRFSIPVIHIVAAACVGLLLVLLVVVEKAPTIENIDDDQVEIASFKIPSSVSYTDRKLSTEGSTLEQITPAKDKVPVSGGRSLGIQQSPQPTKDRGVAAIYMSGEKKGGFVTSTVEKAVPEMNIVQTVESGAKNEGDKKIVDIKSKIKQEEAQSADTKLATEKVVAINAVPVSQSQDNTGLSQREEWLLTLNPQSFTIQLLGARDEQAVKVFTKKYKNISQLAYYKTQHKGQGWYVVVQGEYSSRQNAQDAIAAFPVAIKSRKPWTRRVGDVQKSIRRNPS